MPLLHPGRKLAMQHSDLSAFSKPCIGGLCAIGTTRLSEAGCALGSARIQLATLMGARGHHCRIDSLPELTGMPCSLACTPRP